MTKEVGQLNSPETMERLKELSTRLAQHKIALLWSPIVEKWVTVKTGSNKPILHDALYYISQHPDLADAFGELPVLLRIRHSYKHNGFEWEFITDDDDREPIHSGWTRPTRDSAKALDDANQYARKHNYKINGVEITPELPRNFKLGDDYDEPYPHV